MSVNDKDNVVVNGLLQCLVDIGNEVGVAPEEQLNGALEIIAAIRKLKDERDALAAYAEDFCSAAYQASEVMDDFNKDQCEARNRLDHFRYNSHESVKKSLARRDALQQAEALACFNRYESQGLTLEKLQEMMVGSEKYLRRQAEGHQ